MKYRNVGRSGIRVSEVALGGWLTYGSTVDQDATRRIIRTALDHGVNFIDLADAYGNGRCEEVVGQAIQRVDRHKLVLSSKLYWPMSEDPNDRGLSRKHIFESVERSLQRIGTDYLDFYFCHRYDESTPLEETVRAMDDLVHQGKVLYWGTSMWPPEQIKRAAELSSTYNLYAPLVEQPRYNMLDRRIETEIMPVVQRHGMGLMVWSPLAQGLLTGKYNDGIPAGSRADQSSWLDDELTRENIDKVRQLGTVADELGITLAQLAIAWILRQDTISCAITGATRPEHVRANVRAVSATEKLTSAVLEKIDTILDNDPASAASSR